VLRRDPLLRPRLHRRPGVRVLTGISAFEIAVRAVVGQQISVAGARTVCERIVRRCGSGPGSAEPAWCFPTPGELATAHLGDVGLTCSRERTLHHLATAVRDGTVVLDADRPADTVRRELLAVKGIGAWTADYVAMRGLRDADAFPSGDLGLQRASGLDARALATRAEAWRPWRAYAAALLWLADGPTADRCAEPLR
jgi:3-methyladenine DNA glycosylase/8-oxoguanine DNA glycosylase